MIPSTPIGWEFSPEVIEKARRLLDLGHLNSDHEALGLYWVTSEGQEGRRYRVQTDALPGLRTVSRISCSCPHGAHTGGRVARCSHAVAVLIAIKENCSCLTI